MKQRYYALLPLLLLCHAPAHAEDRSWSLSPYLWASGIDGAVATGPVNADFSADFDDIVNVLEGGILLAFEVRSGRNALFADLISLALDEDDARETAGGELATDVDVLILEAGYGRTLSPGFRIEAGARYWDFDARLDPPVAASIERSSAWVDAFAGVLVESPLGQHWSFRVRGNAGGGGSDVALEVDAEFARAFASGNELTLGFRGLDIERRDGGSDPVALDLRFAGLTIGYTFNW